MSTQSTFNTSRLHHLLTRIVGSPGTGGRSGPAASSRQGGAREVGGVDEVEAVRRDRPGFCSTGTFSDLAWGTPEEASPPPLALSSSGEVEEEREVVEDVLDDEE